MFSAKPLASDVEAFVEHLAGRGWILARLLLAELQVNRRHLRALAEASKGRVISGNQGYKLTAEASREELQQANQRLSSQAQKNLLRTRQSTHVWEEAHVSGTAF